MKRTTAVRLFALFLVFALCLVLPATQLLAEDKKDAKKDDQAPQAKAGDKTVYTTDDLKRDIAAQGDAAAGAVYNNRYLSERFAAPANPDAAFTNQDLRERFGNETPGTTPAAPAPATEAASTAPEAAATPGTPPPQAATRPITDEERARRIDVLEKELAQLEQRVLAIKNPLLAGTAAPLEGEKAGMDAVARLKVTEAKIDELKKSLEELKK